MEDIKEKKPGSNKILIAVIVFLFLLILIAGYILYRINLSKKALQESADAEIKKTIDTIKKSKSSQQTPAPQNITVVTQPSANGQPPKQEMPVTTHIHETQPPAMPNTTLDPGLGQQNSTTASLPPEVNQKIFVTSKMARIYAQPDTNAPILDEKKPVANGRLQIGVCSEVIPKGEGQPRWLKMKPVNLGDGLKECYVREDFVELFSN